jgi:hypothetical protein
MVQIPGGPFYIGDKDTTIQNREGSFYQFSNKNRYQINSEKEITTIINNQMHC